MTRPQRIDVEQKLLTAWQRVNRCWIENLNGLIEILVLWPRCWSARLQFGISDPCGKLPDISMVLLSKIRINSSLSCRLVMIAWSGFLNCYSNSSEVPSPFYQAAEKGRVFTATNQAAMLDFPTLWRALSCPFVQFSRRLTHDEDYKYSWCSTCHFISILVRHLRKLCIPFPELRQTEIFNLSTQLRGPC